DPPIEVGLGSGKFTLFHQADLVVRRPSDLILDCLAPRPVADSQAVDAMFNQQSVLGNVRCLGLGPLSVVAPVERVTSGLVRQGSLALCSYELKQAQQAFLQLRILRD